MTASMILEHLSLVVAALIFAVLRSDPAEKGLAPCGHQEAPAGQKTPARKAHGDIPRAAFVLLVFASLFMGAVANPGFVHLSVLFSGEGFSAGAVAAIISGTGLMLTLGKLLYGETTDHVGGCRSTLLFGAILVAGHVLCCLAFLQSIPLSVLTAVCMGVGYPIATIGPSVWANDLASPRQYPTVLRRLQVIYAGGALVFATVPGLLADRFGDYLPAYILFSCLVLVSLLLIALSYRAGRKVRTEHKA